MTSTPALFGGSPVRQEFLPFSRPSLGEAEKTSVCEVLDSGWLSTGPKTKQFETKIAQYLGAKHAMALFSCTHGLHLSLLAAGVGPGDEVITSPFTFVSTANVIVHAGATPVFADIRPDTYNIDSAQIANKISDKTKALLPVHYGGQPCDLDPINQLAREHDLVVIQDAATAIGSQYNGNFLGSTEHEIVAFSFYANKTMTTAEGGMVVTGRDDIAETVRTLSLHGMTRDAWKRYSACGPWYFEVHQAGFKCNMTDLQAAIGLCQLPRLESFISRREELCNRYDEAFSQLAEITIPTVLDKVRSSRYLYPILIDLQALTIDRKRFVEALRAENIGTSVHYIPVHQHPFYRRTISAKLGSFPVADSVYERLISLPLFYDMTDQDADDVVAAVLRLVQYCRR